MEDVTATLESRIAKQDLTVSIEVPEDAATFVADSKRVRKILLNLLSNAIGFSRRGGSIRMGTRRDDHDLLLWVADTGGASIRSSSRKPLTGSSRNR